VDSPPLFSNLIPPCHYFPTTVGSFTATYPHRILFFPTGVMNSRPGRCPCEGLWTPSVTRTETSVPSLLWRRKGHSPFFWPLGDLSALVLSSPCAICSIIPLFSQDPVHPSPLHFLFNNTSDPYLIPPCWFFPLRVSPPFPSSPYLATLFLKKWAGCMFFSVPAGRWLFFLPFLPIFGFVPKYVPGVLPILTRDAHPRISHKTWPSPSPFIS